MKIFIYAMWALTLAALALSLVFCVHLTSTEIRQEGLRGIVLQVWYGESVTNR